VKDYPFACPIAVRWRDIDAYDHVNNAVYVSYLETARVEAWMTWIREGRLAAVVPLLIVRLEIDYRRPIALGEPVEVGLGVKRLGDRSFTLAYRIEAAGELAAEAETVQVCFDRETGRSAALPADLRAALETARVTAD
jgi:acyl-CoA thioester hydrolase